MLTYIASILAAASPSPAAGPSPMGYCGFEVEGLSFAGSAIEQARCLLSPVRKSGRLGPKIGALPPTLGRLLRSAPLPPKVSVERYLRSAGLDAGDLGSPVSTAGGGDPDAPRARYFVIHDTSTPYLGDEFFPKDMDTNEAVNAFEYYFPPDADPQKSPVAHYFVNRRGEVRMGHDFSVPWRATKFETQIVGLPSKGLFLHIENVQPRRRDPMLGAEDDSVAPEPGLTQAQYDRLALLYIAASTRAGAWLIPAFHAVLDQGITNGHDDPQNFDLSRWDASLRRCLNEIGRS